MSSSKFLIKFFPFVKIIVPLTQWVGIWWSGCIFDCTYCIYLSCFLFTGTSLLSTYTLKASFDFVHQINLSSTKWIRSAKSSSLADFSEWTRHFCSTFLLCAYLDWTKSNTSFLVYQWHSWCANKLYFHIFWENYGVSAFAAPSACLMCTYALISFLWTAMILSKVWYFWSIKDFAFLYPMWAGCCIQ